MRKLYIDTGAHDLINSPVTFQSEEALSNHSVIVCRDKCFPVQLVDAHHIYSYCVRPDFLARDSVYEFDIISNEEKYNSFNDIKTEISANGAVIKNDIFEFCTYYTGTDIPKPYLGPFKSEFGDFITRYNYTGSEHPHHRGVWISHGDVNGADTWNEPENHGYISNIKIDRIGNGKVFTRFEATNIWTHHNKLPICREHLTINVYNGRLDLQIVNIDLALHADYGEINLGRTKEAGPIAVRMADEFIVPNGGIIKNSCGGVNESEIWMRKAMWSDYCGTGKSGKSSGIAVFDHPWNDSYPSAWHTRNYGLMAVNNFYNGEEKIIPEYGVMNFHYRLIIHSGMTEEAKIAEVYNNYINPPSAVIK